MNDWSRRRRDWEEQRLNAAVGRAPERRPRFTTISDVEVERLYGPWSWDSHGPDGAPGTDGRRGARTAPGEPAGAGGPTAVDHRGDPLARGRWDDFDPARDVGFPGDAPFTRGIHPTGYRGRLWTMRMFA